MCVVCVLVYVCVCGGGGEHMSIDVDGENLDLEGVFPLAGAPPKNVCFKMFVISQNVDFAKRILPLIPASLVHTPCVCTVNEICNRDK